LTLKDSLQRLLEFAMTDELLDGSACGASLRVAIWKPSLDFLPLADRIAKGAVAVTVAIGEANFTIAPRRRLIVVGATELASHLASAAQSADFHVTIVDPRPAFATRRRQPDADDLVIEWPQDVLPPLLATADALVVMAHDAKLDLPALKCALDSNVPYVGALGSARAQLVRRESLAELGYDEDLLDRIHGPVGLDLGAVTNSQIACAILGEMLKVLNGRSGHSLSGRESPKTGEANSLRQLIFL
jgi:xanthine/CO dehydrogenase XdhC/CoxF family maturation factor